MYLKFAQVEQEIQAYLFTDIFHRVFTENTNKWICQNLEVRKKNLAFRGKL